MQTSNTSTVEIIVGSISYFIPHEIWAVACKTFDQQYYLAKLSTKKICVPTLARKIAKELMPSSKEDYFSEERLTRCLLSFYGKKSKKIKNKNQLDLPF